MSYAFSIRSSGLMMSVRKRACVGPGLPGEKPCPGTPGPDGEPPTGPTVFETASPQHIRCTPCAAIRHAAVVLAAGRRRDKREKAARAKKRGQAA